jgi:hypothetical protein
MALDFQQPMARERFKIECFSMTSRSVRVNAISGHPPEPVIVLS